MCGALPTRRYGAGVATFWIKPPGSGHTSRKRKKYAALYRDAATVTGGRISVNRCGGLPHEHAEHLVWNCKEKSHEGYHIAVKQHTTITAMSVAMRVCNINQI
jgi:hypothetical protein